MDNNKKKIIILGSSGFIGKNMYSFFSNNTSYQIFHCNRNTANILNENELNNFVESIKPNIIINCAGIVGSSESNKEKYDEYNIFQNNILLNMNVLNCCKKYNVSKLIHFSTYRAFGNDICEKYNESNFHSCYNISNNKGYLFSKKVLDLQIQLFKQNSSTEIICLILPNIFGSHDKFDLNGRIVPALISKIQKAKQNNDDLYLHTNGNNLVNLIYVEDVCNIVFNCIKDDLFKEENILIFNKKGTIKLKKITEILKNQMDFHNNIIFENDSEIINNTFIMQPDISLFESIFNNYTFYDIEKGLKETIHFYAVINMGIS